MHLRELRREKGLTQAKCAAYLGIPIRTYQNYESDLRKRDTMKYLYMVRRLEEYDREGIEILSVQQIREACQPVFAKRAVSFCYLFGSYAKGRATAFSDVDLLVGTEETGLAFFDMTEELREVLHKPVDVLNHKQLNENRQLTYEILKDGIKIYG